MAFFYAKNDWALSIKDVELTKRDLKGNCDRIETKLKQS